MGSCESWRKELNSLHDTRPAYEELGFNQPSSSSAEHLRRISAPLYSPRLCGILYEGMSRCSQDIKDHTDPQRTASPSIQRQTPTRNRLFFPHPATSPPQRHPHLPCDLGEMTVSDKWDDSYGCAGSWRRIAGWLCWMPTMTWAVSLLILRITSKSSLECHE